jgi:trigger factor
MAVQVEQEQLEPCRVALRIDVPPEEFQKAVSSVFNQLAKRTSVPGFRPGKAPLHLMKRYIDEGRVREIAIDQTLNNAYRDAVRQAGVRPYQEAEPQVELPQEEVDPEKGFSFKATVALQPLVELGDLEGLTARRVVTPIKDEDVNKELSRYLEAAATFEPTEDAAQEGDRVRAIVEVTLDGEIAPDLSFAEPTLIPVGANLETFDEGLKGVTAGSEKTFEFTFPEDFPDEARRGKTATAKVTASDVLRRTVPEASDEFARKAGFDTVEALRNRVKEMLRNQSDAMANQDVNDSLIREVVRRATVHYPDEMLEREVSERMGELIKALERRSVTLEQYLDAEEKDLATLQSQIRGEALEVLTNTLVLLEVAKENGIVVTEKDVEDDIRQRAEAEGVKLSQMRRLLNDTGEMGTIRNRIFLHKVTGLLREKAAIREIEG